MDEIIIFISQFCMIFLLGFQHRNVAQRLYIPAMFTSLLLGIFGWFTITILSTAYTYDVFSTLFVAYIIAGPLAIVSAMKSHDMIFLSKEQTK
jgi:hypothetical protein